MKIEIEVYKEQTIFYDDDSDKFVCEISIEDNSKKSTRTSLKALRIEIDQFIKLNVNFKPFKAILIDEYDKSDFKVIEITALRTDGRFVANDLGSTYQKRLGKDKILNARILDSEISDERERLRKEKDDYMKAYHGKVKALTNSLKPLDLSKYDLK